MDAAPGAPADRITDGEPLPRYAEIRRELETAILTGRWPPGHRVPSEHELVARYGCSRMTVNKALSALATAGLIVRRRRSGSYVATPEADESILEIRDMEAEARREGKAYRFEISARAERKATVRDAARLGVAVGVPVLAMKVVHFTAELPQVMEERLINLEIVPAARKADFSQKPPGSWLLAQIPWTQARHRISAINADAGIARVLGITPGAACLVVERETWQANEPVTHVLLTYPGDRHHLVARFGPPGGTRG